MMRSQRKAAPLVALLVFEIGAIALLTAMGKAEGMGIPWSEFSAWVTSTSGTDIAAPVVRLLALGVAYWMLISTALFAVAQISRIPAAIRATSKFTLPSVRRVVDGAVVVSLATTTLVGFGVGTASAATSSDSANIITAGDLSVKSPTPGASVGQNEVVGTSSTTSSTTSTTQAPVTSPGTGGDLGLSGNLGLSGGDTTDSNQAADGSTTTTTSTTAAPTTTTTAAPTTTTTGAPTTTTTVASGNESAGGQTSGSSVTPIAPSAGNNSVRTPRPGAPATTTTTTTAAPAPAPTPAPQTEVAGVQDHRVVKGENFWTIARATVAEQGGKEAKAVTESEVRDYWLKLVAENKDNIRSGDPHWIFPGETIKLPAVK